MPDYNSVINNLNRKLFFKLNKIKVVPDDGNKEKTVEEMMGGYVGGMGFSQHYGGLSNTHTTDPRDAKTFDNTYKTHTTHSIRKDHQAKGRKQKIKDDEDENKKHFVDLSGESGEEDYEEDMKMSEIEAPPAAPPEGAEPEPEPTATEDPEAAEAAGGDFAPDPEMGAGGDMADPGLGDPMAGMPGQEEPKNPNELGRTYEMKKIYSRLVSMNQY